MCASNLSRVVAWQRTGQESNPRPVDRESISLTTTSVGRYNSADIREGR